MRDDQNGCFYSVPSVVLQVLRTKTRISYGASCRDTRSSRYPRLLARKHMPPASRLSCKSATPHGAYAQSCIHIVGCRTRSDFSCGAVPAFDVSGLAVETQKLWLLCINISPMREMGSVHARFHFCCFTRLEVCGCKNNSTPLPLVLEAACHIRMSILPKYLASRFDSDSLPPQKVRI
jgi:hypothetical protein